MEKIKRLVRYKEKIRKGNTTVITLKIFQWELYRAEMKAGRCFLNGFEL